VIERIAVALELIAARLGDPNAALVARVALCEELLRDFVALMADPHSTDVAWNELLAEACAALDGDSI
jgi:hypothetical protein